MLCIKEKHLYIGIQLKGKPILNKINFSLIFCMYLYRMDENEFTDGK